MITSSEGLVRTFNVRDAREMIARNMRYLRPLEEKERIDDTAVFESGRK